MNEVSAVTFIFRTGNWMDGFEEVHRVTRSVNTRSVLPQVVRELVRETSTGFEEKFLDSWTPYPGWYTEFRLYDVRFSELFAIGNRPSPEEELCASRHSKNSFLVLEDGTVARISSLRAKDFYNVEGLERANNAGLSDIDLTKIYVYPPVSGRGGDVPPPDLVIWLLEHGVDLGVGMLGAALFEKFAARFRGTKADKQARKIAKAWANGGIESPFVLRRFVDLKDSWVTDELSERLGINIITARHLLCSLGYVEEERVWKLGKSRRAQKARKKWIEDEEQ